MTLPLSLSVSGGWVKANAASSLALLLLPVSLALSQGKPVNEAYIATTETQSARRSDSE